MDENGTITSELVEISKISFRVGMPTNTAEMAYKEFMPFNILSSVAIVGTIVFILFLLALVFLIINRDQILRYYGWNVAK